MTPLSTTSIETERLTLLPLRVAHAEEMAAALADPALHTFIGGEPATAEELRRKYAAMVAGSPLPVISWCNWVIGVRPEDGRDSRDMPDGHGRSPLAGYVQATVAPGRHGAGPVAEIAWVVGTPWQRRGIAKEAARGLVRWLAERDVRTLRAHIHPDHRASAAVAASLGLAPTDEWYDGEVRWQRHLDG
ncbi:GNAT family N-acetyltransferase [Streptomyces sp. NPDC093109]|uniref:GNAT family N-acetyltransferase n=1 Tax=Streptomyces sp. NPDC093109 TaxID=3154977 RepID=UPI00344BB618